MLRAANGQVLYCACLVFHEGPRMIPKEEYFHADDMAHANAIIRKQYPNRNKVTISAVAPAVGFFASDAEDKHGRIYTTS